VSKPIHISVLLVFALILFIPGMVSMAPTSTDLNNMWVSENATDFWFMNNPDSTLENDISVFHYDSEFNLVERINPEGLERERKIAGFVRSDEKWFVVVDRTVRVFDSSWNALRSEEVMENDSYSARDIEVLDDGSVRIIFEQDDRHYSYELDTETLELENRTGVIAVEPSHYRPTDKMWVNFNHYNFRTETESAGPNNNYTRETQFLSTDGQIENGSIWILKGTSMGSYREPANVYRYTRDMNYTNESYPVGLNQSQIKLDRGPQYMDTGPGEYLLTFGHGLAFIVAVLILIIYFVRK
jgi:hypothetical protein